MEDHSDPAFPTGNNEQGGQAGMTLRDWFAGQALAGIMANPSVVEVPDGRVYQAAYRHADGMIAQRAE